MAASRKPSPSKAVEACVAAVLARHVPAGARVVLAYSGGLDSSVLLHGLVALRARSPFSLSAVHVHHGLSPHADDWGAFCASRCADLAVPLTVERVHLQAADPAGVEAAARRARHQVFARLDADFLLTAHHQDDQAETLLLQALRGAGPKGLAAMAECQRPGGWRPMQLRPLLGMTRAQLQAAATALDLRWVEDESNASDRYRRNVLRHQIMPRLAAHFPGSAATLSRVAAHQAEAAELLDALAALDAADSLSETTAGLRLDCAALVTLPPARARNLLRFFIARHEVALPGTRRLDEALQQLVTARRDARVQIAFGQAVLWGWRGGAYVVPATPLPAPVVWQGEPRLHLPGLGTLDFRPALGCGLRQADCIPGRLVLGCRQGGEHLRVSAAGPVRSVKGLLQAREVPPWTRARLPVLRCDDATVWVEGLGCHAGWLAGPDEAGWLPVWRVA